MLKTKLKTKHYATLQIAATATISRNSLPVIPLLHESGIITTIREMDMHDASFCLP